MILKGQNAISKNRELMGTTNPAEATLGSICADFLRSLQENAVHGSDAPETAAIEVACFFSAEEICSCTR